MLPWSSATGDMIATLCGTLALAGLRMQHPPLGRGASRKEAALREEHQLPLPSLLPPLNHLLKYSCHPTLSSSSSLRA